MTYFKKLSKFELLCINLRINKSGDEKGCL
jgi:hypothetical protein